MGEKQEAFTGKSRPQTFTVQIQYQENATWQGTILWVEEKQAMHFRSALELLKLMDSALDQAGKKEESDKKYIEKSKHQINCGKQPSRAVESSEGKGERREDDEAE